MGWKNNLLHNKYLRLSDKKGSQQAKMKTILASKTVTIPKNVTVKLVGRKISVTGPRGTLNKSFEHLNLELTRVGKNTIRVDCWFASRNILLVSAPSAVISRTCS